MSKHGDESEEMARILDHWANRWETNAQWSPDLGGWTWEGPAADVVLSDAPVLRLGVHIDDAGALHAAGDKTEAAARWRALQRCLDAYSMPAESPILGHRRMADLKQYDLPERGPLQVTWALPLEGTPQQLAEKLCTPFVWCQWFAEEFARMATHSKQPALDRVSGYPASFDPKLADPVDESEFLLMRALVGTVYVLATPP